MIYFTENAVLLCFCHAKKNGFFGSSVEQELCFRRTYSYIRNTIHTPKHFPEGNVDSPKAVDSVDVPVI